MNKKPLNVWTREQAIEAGRKSVQVRRERKRLLLLNPPPKRTNSHALPENFCRRLEQAQAQVLDQVVRTVNADRKLKLAKLLRELLECRNLSQEQSSPGNGKKGFRPAPPPPITGPLQEDPATS